MSNTSSKWEQEYKYNVNNILITKQDIINMMKKYIKDKKVLSNFKVNDIDIYIKAFAQKGYVKEQHKLIENCSNGSNKSNKSIKSNKSNESNKSNGSNGSDESIKISKEIYLPKESNERLEFLGDRMIDATICNYLFQRFPDQNEGFLTKLKIKLVKTDGLCNLAKHIGLEKWLLLPSHLDQGNRAKVSSKILENTFEAFVGAIVRDNPIGIGYEICYNFIVGILEKHIVFHELILFNDNYIDSLIKYSHSQKWEHPTIKVVYSKGKSNNRTFCIVVLINKSYIHSNNHKPFDYQKKILGMITNRLNNYFSDDDTCDINDNNLPSILELINGKSKIIVGMGYGASKKKAEQIACKFALMNLNIPLNF